MKRKIVWLVISCLMVAALLLASCAPAVTEEEEVVKKEEVVKEEKVVKEEVVVEEKEMVKDSLGRLVEKPQYGGWLNFCPKTPNLGWDQTRATAYHLYPYFMVGETLITGDWAKGPAGTNETSWLSYAPPPFDLWKGNLAESWEIPQRDTVIYHLRKGVHFGLNPDFEASRLVGGREMTADDVVYTINWIYSVSTAYFIGATSREVPVATALDKYTVEVKWPNPVSAPMNSEYIGQLMRVVAPEVVEKYGNTLDWRNCVGTGPFMMVDDVPGSSQTLVRNPNYWKKDPLQPENQLPYLDGVKYLEIADASTRIAALRTGKIDHTTDVLWEDAEAIMKTNPELKFLDFYNFNPYTLYLRVDNPERPFYDKKVRQALSMAIDREAIAKDFYGGKAHILNYPVAPEFPEAYIPLEDLPESVRLVLEYHPEKAKQLLSEAGYPDGFTCKVITEAKYVDYLSIFKEYFAAIGVDMEIDVREYGVHSSIGKSFAYDDMFARHLGTKLTNNVFKLLYWRKGQANNYSRMYDPKMEDAFNKFSELYYDWDAKIKLTKELIPYILENCWVIQPPNPAQYTFWQPWLKNYHGEYGTGYLLQNTWIWYAWLDLDLKKELTGK
ncbi:ABC transporter substrate-binding protein [Chloroflexota bacterium]